MTKLPTYYSAAKKALATVVRVDEVKDIRDKAHAMRIYAIQAKDPQLASDSTEVKRRATRRIGELMEEQRKAGELAKGGGDQRSKHRGKKSPGGPPTLADQDIDKDLAKLARAAAKQSKEQFEMEMARAKALAVAAASGHSAVIKAAKAERHENKKKARAERENDLAKKIFALPTKVYGVIYADPEWKFKFFSEKGQTNSSAENHYGTSALEAIKKRDIPSISANDCVLFLWATVPMMPQALEVMAAWGFSYKSSCCWVKSKAGTGYWFRNKHELLLVGTRGNIPAPAEGAQWVSAIEAPTGKHSAKPEIFAEMIEQYYPNLPRIELNRRGAPRQGWDAWGNEAELAEAAE